MVGHVLPYPPTAGNEIRILKMVHWLRSRGFRVVMLFNHEAVSVERRRELEQMLGTVHFVGDDRFSSPDREGRPWRHTLARLIPDSLLYKWIFGQIKRRKVASDDIKASLAPPRMVRATRELCETYRPQAVIAEYIFASPCLDGVPDHILRVIDTHDMFSRKQSTVVTFGVEDPLVCSRREERRYLLKGDVVLAVQPNEGRLLRELVPSRDVIDVGIDFDVVQDSEVSFVTPGRVLVVGSDNPLNAHGLAAFHRHAWPAIRASRPDAILRVVGTLSRHLDTDDERIQRCGWVADLDDEYRQAAVVINPVQAGTGLKIKSVEALCRGKAFVGTPNSVDGIESDGPAPYRVCADWPAFANAVNSLLSSDDERRRLERAAVSFSREQFSTERTYAALAERLAVHACRADK